MERHQERLRARGDESEGKFKSRRSQNSGELRNEKSFEKCGKDRVDKDKVDLTAGYKKNVQRDHPSTSKVEKDSRAIMAVVKHMVDSQSGLLELFQGGERKAVLFHMEQVHLDRDSHNMGSRSCNARPTSNSRQFQAALHPGQRVLVVVQPVEAKLVALQAVALWLSGCRMPRFSINQKKLREQFFTSGDV